MKKYLLYLAIIPATISIAASNIDLKLATNFGIGLEGGTYYNLFGTSNYSKITGQKAIFENKVAFTGSFEAKVLKSFSIKKDLTVKVGAGASIDITKLPILDKFVEVIIGGKKKTKAENNESDNISLPHSNGWGVGLSIPFQSGVKGIERDQWGDIGGDINDAKTQMPKLIDLSRKQFYASLTAFGTIEIEKIFKNFSVYFGVDAGLDIVLEKIEETATYEIKNKKDNSYKYTLERRKNRVRPKLKGYVGINYKGFETEIGFGYPQFVTFGVGYRFNL